MTAKDRDVRTRNERRDATAKFHPWQFTAAEAGSKYKKLYPGAETAVAASGFTVLSR